MAARLSVQSSEGVNEAFLNRVRKWANEVLEKKGPMAAPSLISVNIWRRMDELQSFYQREKRQLGVVTGEETEFLATHEAWRGHSRIHICQERVKAVPDAVMQGVLHHEISHALHHGTPEFYTFKFSKKLQEAGHICGLDLTLLQQCAYLLSVAIKDHDVVAWLAEIGLGFGQLALLEYLVSDTEDERRIWEVVCAHSAQRKLALALFLKTLLPIETLVSLEVERAEVVKNKWNAAYLWLAETIQEGLIRFVHDTMTCAKKPFQQRLENATFKLITEAWL